MSRTATIVGTIRTRLLANNAISSVIIGTLTDATDASIGLIPYPIDDDLYSGTSMLGVQVTIRGTATGGVKPVLNMQDTVLDVIGTIRLDTFTDIPVSLAWRQMSAPLALDGRGRPEVKDTYYLRADRLGLAG